MNTNAVVRSVMKSRGLQRHRGEELFAALMRQDEALVARGFPRLTPWWRETLRAFYCSGKRRLVTRVGRKGTKSATLCRVAVNEALNGDHLLRPGDLGLVMFISENIKEARSRLFTIKAILDALGVLYDLPEGDVRLRDRAVVFGVRAARIGTVSGPTVLCLVADEVAKWRDEETGSNPATEVLRSVRPAMVTQRNAHEFMISSPWSTLDAHHDAFVQGNTQTQAVAHAPSWEANDTITEQETHDLEPDEMTWRREYAAEPMGATEVQFFDHRMIEAAVDDGLTLPFMAAPGVEATAGGDLGFISDSAALAITHRYGQWDAVDAQYALGDLLEMRPSAEAPLMPGVVIRAFAERLKAHGIGHLMADGHYRLSAIEHLQAEGLYYVDAPTESHLYEPFVRTRVLINGRRLRIPRHPRLIRQLKEVMGVPRPNGTVAILSPRKAGGGHGDIVSALVRALWQRSGKAKPLDDSPRRGTAEWYAKVAKDEFERDVRESLEQGRDKWENVEER